MQPNLTDFSYKVSNFCKYIYALYRVIGSQRSYLVTNSSKYNLRIALIKFGYHNIDVRRAQPLQIAWQCLKGRDTEPNLFIYVIKEQLPKDIGLVETFTEDLP